MSAFVYEFWFRIGTLHEQEYSTKRHTHAQRTTKQLTTDTVRRTKCGLCGTDATRDRRRTRARTHWRKNGIQVQVSTVHEDITVSSNYKFVIIPNLLKSNLTVVTNIYRTYVYSIADCFFHKYIIIILDSRPRHSSCSLLRQYG